MTVTLRCISSMATRHLLAELMRGGPPGIDWHSEAIGGVAAAKRVAEGEPFDLVILAADAIDKLAAGGHVAAGSERGIVTSAMAVAIRTGTPPPPVDTEAALKQSIEAAASIGFSTGPSGTALMALFDRWGIRDALNDKLVQAPTGVPVASLVAEGKVAIGFQQLSELQGVPDVTVIGEMPPGLEIVTTFSGAIATTSAHPAEAATALAWLAGPPTAEAKRRHGMLPVDLA